MSNPNAWREHFQGSGKAVGQGSDFEREQIFTATDEDLMLGLDPYHPDEWEDELPAPTLEERVIAGELD